MLLDQDIFNKSGKQKIKHRFVESTFCLSGQKFLLDNLRAKFAHNSRDKRGNANLGFQRHNCALCALKIVDATLIATFMTAFGTVKLI
jgi:hypothetical protein